MSDGYLLDGNRSGRNDARIILIWDWDRQLGFKQNKKWVS